MKDWKEVDERIERAIKQFKSDNSFETVSYKHNELKDFIHSEIEQAEERARINGRIDVLQKLYQTGGELKNLMTELDFVEKELNELEKGK